MQKGLFWFAIYSQNNFKIIYIFFVDFDFNTGIMSDTQTANCQNLKGDKMNLYNVTFTNGETMQEYGDDLADLKQFFARCYPHLTIASVELY